jgi:uncharacterized LabA/DUF88 family protein
MSCFAVLVDGGFIKRCLGSQQHPLTAGKFSDFLAALAAHDALKGHRLHRVYFYDAAPLTGSKKRPLNGGQDDFGSTPTAQQNRTLHAELVRLPFVALRMGELAFRGWTLRPGALPQNAAEVVVRADDLRADIQQKGVDMRIGLDIAALTLKKLANVIVLVTADSDFVPAMKFARREGAQLFLAPLGSPIKEAMREHSDLVLDFPGFARSPAGQP